MQEFVTSLGDTHIKWQVELPWQSRKRLWEIGAVDGGGVVDTTQVVAMLFPECLKGWSLAEALTEEAFWNLAFTHKYQLAVMVGLFLMSSVNQSRELDADGNLVPLEAEPEIPLASSSEPAETATTSTPGQ